MPKASTQTVSSLPTTGKVFVYGTLKQGWGNHRLLEGAYYGDGVPSATFLGKAVTAVAYPMMAIDVPYPYLFDSPGKGQPVWGEVYEVTDPRMMERLDQLEGVPHHYQRKTINVIIEGQDTEQEVMVYFLNRQFEDRYLNQCASIFEGERHFQRPRR